MKRKLLINLKDLLLRRKQITGETFKEDYLTASNDRFNELIMFYFSLLIT